MQGKTAFRQLAMIRGRAAISIDNKSRNKSLQFMKRWVVLNNSTQHSSSLSSCWNFSHPNKEQSSVMVCDRESSSLVSSSNRHYHNLGVISNNNAIYHKSRNSGGGNQIMWKRHCSHKSTSDSVPAPPSTSLLEVGEDVTTIDSTNQARIQGKKNFFSTVSKSDPLDSSSSSTPSSNEESSSSSSSNTSKNRQFSQPPIQTPAGRLYQDDEDSDNLANFIPQIPMTAREGQQKKRVLVLCTGGTLTMTEDPHRDNALAPVEGALTKYLSQMTELEYDTMPEVVAHEYIPLLDSSDMGPSDWALLAKDIKTNYYHFDGFVVLMGTDTMAYAATALSFMLENLGKPVVVTGSQIPLCEPYNDARRNLVMALIFASRESICEVTIFFHDRLLRACRSTKVNTTRLLAFDSPNIEPLAKIGINIEENEHLSLPQSRGVFKIHTRMDTRLLTIRLVPGFDDQMMKQMIHAATETHLQGLVLQLYGTGNIPSIKDDFVKVLAEATENGVHVVATSQCFTGSVMMGHYATGRALASAGVVSANDMTVEATTCKLAYLLGRGDLSFQEISNLMDVSLRGEVTPLDDLPPPPLASAYQRASRKGRKRGI